MSIQWVKNRMVCALRLLEVRANRSRERLTLISTQSPPSYRLATNLIYIQLYTIEHTKDLQLSNGSDWCGRASSLKHISLCSPTSGYEHW